MIQTASGNIFDSSAQALVNPVNCQGVMGAGLALQFRWRYPAMFADYWRACREGALRPGHLHTFQEGGVLIINFPTKDRWQQPSQLEYIQSGADALADLIVSEGIPSVAVPPLGCGLGGLSWTDVQPVLENALSKVPAEIILVGLQIFPGRDRDAAQKRRA